MEQNKTLSLSRCPWRQVVVWNYVKSYWNYEATSMFEKKFLCEYKHMINTKLMKENDSLAHDEISNLVFDI